MINYGLIIPEIKQEDHLFGASTPYIGEPIKIDGQWDDYLPDIEVQWKPGVETYSCSVFGTESVVEILHRQLGIKSNFSDRWLAHKAGISEQGGDPHEVAEKLRKLGVPNEYKWSFTEDVKSFADWIKTPPEYLENDAKEDFLKKYEFKHYYLEDRTILSIKDALRYSPVCISVNAWHVNAEGVYVKQAPDNHWVVVYGWDDKKRAWKIFDTYDNFTKLYSFDAQIQMAKGYWCVVRTTPYVDENGILTMLRDALLKLVDLYKQLIAQKKTEPPPVVIPPVVRPPIEKTPAEKLYDTAYGCLGKDMAKTQDELGCAEAVNAVHKKCFGVEIGGSTSTYNMLVALRNHDKFREIKTPEKGCIIISPTGWGNGIISNGHVGICGKTHIMSNNSDTGLWDTAFTLDSWKKYYHDKGGYPIFYFRRV